MSFLRYSQIMSMIHFFYSADGWKSLTKSAINGVCVNVDFKVGCEFQITLRIADLIYSLTHSSLLRSHHKTKVGPLWPPNSR